MSIRSYADKIPDRLNPTGKVTVRVGRPRSHPEGISLNIFRDNPAQESLLLAITYGGTEDEARMRADIVANALGNFYNAEVRT